MTRLLQLLSLILVLLSTIPVEQSEILPRNNAPNTAPPTSSAPLTNLPTTNLHPTSNTNTTALEESVNQSSGQSFSERAPLNDPVLGEHGHLERPGTTVRQIKLLTKEMNDGPRFSCARGAICNIKIAEIVNETQFSNVTVSSQSAGLIFDVTEDKKEIVGLPITHGLASFSLKYDSKDKTPATIDFKVFISEKQHPTHLFFLSLTKPELTCRENPHLCFQLLEDIARSLGGPSSTLTLTRFSKDREGVTIVSFYNNTLSLNECEKGKIENMKTKLAAENDTVNEDFSRSMGDEYALINFSFKPMKNCEGYSSIPLLQDNHSQSFRPSIFGIFFSAIFMIVLMSISVKGVRQFCEKEPHQNERVDQIELGLLENQVEEDVIANEENVQDNVNNVAMVDEVNVV